MIHILDAMTAKPGRLGEVRQLLRERYLPGARARGMRLLGEWAAPRLAPAPPRGEAERGQVPEEWVLLWSVDDVAAWWGMRGQASVDPAVPAFWREADARLEERSRRMLPAPDDPQRPEPVRRARLAPDAWHGERATALLSRAEAADAAAGERLEALARALPSFVPGCLRSEIGRNLPGTLNGGDYTLDLLFEDAAHAARWLEGEWSDRAARREFGALALPVAAVHYAPFEGGLDSPGIASPVKRTLLLRVEPGAPPEQVARFERELAAMPDHIPAIRNWHLARVAGPSWTHVWAQEFEKLDGLQIDYMVHPYHWAIVDRWFDPESPERIVAPDFAHAFCAMPRSVLG